jgi:hypothetical protein
MEGKAGGITFDETGKVRVLDAEKYRQTEELEREARAFASSEWLDAFAYALSVYGEGESSWKGCAPLTLLVALSRFCRDSRIQYNCSSNRREPWLTGQRDRECKAQGRCMLLLVKTTARYL